MRAALSLFVGLAPWAQLAAAVDYREDIRPLFAEKCAACHGALDQEASLRLDSGRLIHHGADSGPVLVPGNAGASRLIQRILSADADQRMPPAGAGEPLDEAQIALIRGWIDAGAEYPADEPVPADAADHWAYQPPIKTSIPLVDDSAWSHPIDAFVAQAQREHGLRPARPADNRTLLRRLYFDLVGLPPTPAQLSTFIDNPSPDAWRHVVDQLLDSPHYGQRWGRHWMDIWRYSDWDGYQDELRGSQRHIWRWRDWIVNSLNADKGYDQMVTEMLAGDELAPNDPDVLPATGFLARNFHPSNRDIWLDATVEHTAKALLATTVNCARCHEHKYDPIPQTDYYRFRAIFEPHNVVTDQLPGQPNLLEDGLPRVFDADLTAATFLYRGGNEKHADREHPLTPAIPAVLGGRLEISTLDLPVEVYYPALQSHIAQAQVSAAREEISAADQALARHADVGQADHKPEPNTSDLLLLQLRKTAADLELRSLAARQAADRKKYQVGRHCDATPLEQLAAEAASAERRLVAHQGVVTVREKQVALEAAQASGDNDSEQQQAAIAQASKELEQAWQQLAAAQAALTKTDATYTPVGKEYPRTSTGRRLALARWIVSRDNPLAARVAVNHIWLRHFGAPLVENVFDFGLRSPRPRHADLLDWLAVELMDNGWSMKHVHRLLLGSRTWRLTSSADDAAVLQNLKLDPDNHYLWRMNVRRLEAEIIRDSILSVSGRLDTSLGGPDIDFVAGETSRRRSIYLRHAYEKQMAMLVQFDAASPNECYRRSESIIPQQALALSNSSLSLGQARTLAGKLWSQVAAEGTNADSRFVQAAFIQVLSRPPEPPESTACLDFLADQGAMLTDPAQLSLFAGGAKPVVQPSAAPDQRARENLVHVLINHNDFVTVR